MKRLHLFEFEDLGWFPAIIRNYMTDYLQEVTNRFDFYRAIVPVIAKGVEKSGTNQILDMASGGGGGWLNLAKHLQAELEACRREPDWEPAEKLLERIKNEKPAEA
jgi:hypothetical protein